MALTRRKFLKGGSVVVAALTLPLIIPTEASAAAPAVIEMIGLPDGSDVWFDPIGLLIRPGQTVRWVNRDAGNSHTATAYHPALFGRSRRIPVHAKFWNSDYLLPDGSFSVTFSEPGVYDYYCVPHEHAGWSVASSLAIRTQRIGGRRAYSLPTPICLGWHLMHFPRLLRSLKRDVYDMPEGVVSTTSEASSLAGTRFTVNTK